MSAKKTAETDSPPGATPPPILTASLRMVAQAITGAAAKATELAERVAVARTSIELARLRGHADPIAEVRAAAFLVLAAGEALQIERQEDDARERMQQEELEAHLHEKILDNGKDHFTEVPFTEIVNAIPTEAPRACGESVSEWRKDWEEGLLNEDFVAVFTGELAWKKVALRDVLTGRQAAFDAALRQWPFKTVSGFKRFLQKWVADIAADKSHEPWDAAECREKVKEYFEIAKAGKVSRNLLDSWKFWRAKRAATEKWGGTTRVEFWNLLAQWTTTIPRHAGQTLTPQKLAAKARRHFQKAIEGKAKPEMVAKWKAFRAVLTKNDASKSK